LRQEISQWNIDGYFDRVSALGMLLLLREDRIILCGGDVTKSSTTYTNPNYLGNDPFFTKNYDNKFMKY
jgi:hypothetical protein